MRQPKRSFKPEWGHPQDPGSGYATAWVNLAPKWAHPFGDWPNCKKSTGAPIASLDSCPPPREEILPKNLLTETKNSPRMSL